MKNKLIYSLGLFLVILNLSFVQETEMSEMSFDRKKHDFGNVVRDSIYSTEFKFTNTGKAPLIIHKIDVSCGCVKTEWTNKPIKPGESARIKVKLTPKNKHGKVINSIYIKNNTKNRLEIIRVYAVVNN
jgi:hypothetical protein bacD2_10677